jgi:hypothetical protein
MRKLIDIAEGVAGICGAVWGFLYYTGRLGYSGKKEERRKEKIEKYRWIMIVSMICMLLGGSGLLLVTLIE